MNISRDDSVELAQYIIKQIRNKLIVKKLQL